MLGWFGCVFKHPRLTERYAGLVCVSTRKFNTMQSWADFGVHQNILCQESLNLDQETKTSPDSLFSQVIKSLIEKLVAEQDRTSSSLSGKGRVKKTAVPGP